VASIVDLRVFWQPDVLIWRGFYCIFWSK